ncbi:isocitrate dehydrogenase [Staphylococcus aureus]|uniref:isocitrate dehydrogenase (NADP(+)) n=1 Tax=Staphylococcus aureus TaxID=1280 RepID=A0A380EIV0_STAAU|nr:isocitrate dehydrogenase [Staphylococcus aureus]
MLIFIVRVVYHCMEIPHDLFTPIFAVSRSAGWIAHILEQYKIIELCVLERNILAKRIVSISRLKKENNQYQIKNEDVKFGGKITMTAEKITQGTEGLNVPNEPIIPFIIGDGIGPDIWKAASRVIDAAVEKAYNGEKRIEWKEVLAGQKALIQLVNGYLKKHLIQLKNI